MRILHIQKISGMSGSELIITELSAELIRRSHSVSVLFLVDSHADISECRERLISAGVRVHLIPIRRHVSLLVFIRMMWWFRRNRFDIVHTHLIHGDLYGIIAARLMGMSGIVSTKHNDDDFKNKRVIRMLERVLSKFTVRIVAVSDWVRRFYIDMGISERKLRIVYNGIVESEVVSSGILHTEYNIPSESIIFFSAARLVKQKGFHVLISAFKQVYSECSDAVLVIAGKGPEEIRLREMIQKYQLENSVHLLGFRKDVSLLLPESDVYVQTSLWEGFGVSFIEAMRAQLPVIAFNVSAIPEIVEHERTGILVSPGDEMALSSAMIHCAKNVDERNRLGKAGYEHWKRKFTCSRMVDEYEAVYREVKESL